MADLRVNRWENNGISALVLENGGEKHSRLIVLLHGYQGDAVSNLEFGKTLLSADESAVVAVFDGVEEVPDRHDPHIRQWWDLPPFEGRYYAAMPLFAPKSVRPALDAIVRDAHKTAVRLNAAVLELMREKKLKTLVLAGISQGGITAFEMALFCSELTSVLDGVVIIGAGIAGADRLRKTAVKPVPFLLVRGTKDDIFPSSVNCFSKSVLTEAGVPVVAQAVDSPHFGLEHAAAEQVRAFISGLNAKNRQKRQDIA